jgi:fatty acid desaturase
MSTSTAPAVTSVRAGDRERERTADQLGQALSQGYLAMDEYETRLQATFAANTTTELRQLVADLPLAQLRRNDPQRRAARRRAARLGVRIHFGAYLAMVVIVLTVWLAVGLTAGAWYFWPIWPILGAGIGVVSHAIPGRFAGPRLCHARPAIDGRGHFSSTR